MQCGVGFQKQNEKRVPNVLGWCEILMIAKEKIGQKLLKFPTANQMVRASAGSLANDPWTAGYWPAFPSILFIITFVEM